MGTCGGIAPGSNGVISLGVFKGSLYAGTTQGKIFASLDGENWEEVAVLNKIKRPNWVRFLKEFKGKFYAGTEHGFIYQSLDGHH